MTYDRNSNYLTEVTDNITILTTGFWLIYPQNMLMTFGKDQIPKFYDEIQYRSWLENRIRDAVSCPSMVRLNNFVERWSLRVRIEYNCEVCKDDYRKMDIPEDLFPDSLTQPVDSCGACGRTYDEYEKALGGYEQEYNHPLAVEFYDNPLAEGDAVVTIEGRVEYQKDPNLSGNANTLLRMSRMVQTYLKKTPNRLINKDYQVDRAYISRGMERRFRIGEWIDEHSYTPLEDLPMRRPNVELRYDKPSGFGYEPAWKTIVHSDSLLSLFG